MKASALSNSKRCSTTMKSVSSFWANLKWANGFTCKKCGNDNSCPGKEPFSRRCTKCKAKETATNGTIFHGVKFPISKAFYIAYNVCKGKEDISSYEFGRRLSLRQMTFIGYRCPFYITEVGHSNVLIICNSCFVEYLFTTIDSAAIEH